MTPKRFHGNSTASIFNVPSSLISEQIVVPAYLTFHLKYLRLTQKCKNHIYKTVKEPKFLQVSWNFYRFKEHIQLPKNVYESSKLKLNYTAEYCLEIDQEFVKMVTESPVVFDLCASGNDMDITLSRAEMEMGDILEAANNKKKKTVFFSNAAIDMSEYVAGMEIFYKFSCNADQMKKLCECVINRKVESQEIAKTVERCRGDGLSQSDETKLDITVVKLFFMDGSRPMVQESVQQVYIEYSFLGEDGLEIEAPWSLRKGTYKNPTCFQWTRTFNFDIETNYQKCKALTQLVQSNEVVKFFVISEPLENFDNPFQICEYVGYAEVCLREIFKWEKDVDTYQYEILDSCNTLFVIGYLTIRFEGIDAMRRALSFFMTPSDFQCL